MKKQLKYQWAAFVVAALSAAVSAGPLENLKPGEWYMVPNSHLYEARPTGWSATVMDPWSGGAYDTQRDRLIVWGGGHGDYSGNEIYVFDINTLKWSLASTPTTNTGGDECSGLYPDGRPRSRHTYNGLQYVPALDRFCAPGAGGFYPGAQCGNGRFAVFDFASASWEFLAATPGGAFSTGQFSAVDPVTGHLWSHGAAGGSILAEFDPTAKIWKSHGNQWTEAYLSYSITADVDPVGRRMIGVGGGEVWSWDLTKSGDIAGTKISTSGATGIIGGKPGVAYDAVSGKLAAWSGGADVYTLNLSTNAWTKHSPAATNSVVPTGANSNGTYGRFRYVLSKNVFVAVNRVTENVYFYKLTAGAGTGEESAYGGQGHPSAKLGAGTAEGKGKISISPNPVSGLALIRAAGPLESVGIYDLRGRLIARPSRMWDASLVPNGVYFLRWKFQERENTRRFLVQK